MSPFVAFDLSIELNRLLSELHWRCRNADLYRQSRRAASSISLHLAEGSGRAGADASREGARWNRELVAATSRYAARAGDILEILRLNNGNAALRLQCLSTLNATGAHVDREQLMSLGVQAGEIGWALRNTAARSE